MTQEYPILKITADFPSRGLTTGTFAFKKCSVSEKTRTGYLVSGGSQIYGLLSEIPGLDLPNNVSPTVNVGGGQHAFELSGEIITSEADGQWGRTDDATTLDETTATGGTRAQKSNVFHNYMRYSNNDSFVPAELIYGEWSPGGVMPEDSLSVAIEDPETSIDRETSSVMNNSLTVVETLDLQDVFTGDTRMG
ncbi:hypothetical protein VB779_08700 [Haloarculaceae archaeon H-GB11]|nr:hypothetical protein [Haloarculaceae archaeon H-GB11]